MTDINTAFQEYLSENADKEPIDFGPLLQKFPHHRERLNKKIKAYQKLIGTLQDEKPEKEIPLLVGRKIGDCKLLRVLGQGGMGVVYLGRQEKLGRDVVVKVLRPFAVDNKALKERFLRESRIIGRLNHKNIVPVYDVGEQEGSFYIIMRYVEGTPLNVLIEKFSKTDRSASKLNEILGLATKTPTEFLCNLIIQISDAVQYAHDNGVIHRDIKPSNIIVEPDGNPVLLDFGLSHDDVEKNLTVSGEFLGTPIYSAPESFQTQGVTDYHLLDIYSLGVTLYELLTGALPYEGDSIYEVYSNIKNKEPIRPKSRWSKIPRDLETIISTAIAKGSQLRYKTIKVFSEDLRSFLNYLPIKAKAPSSIQQIYYYARRKRNRLLVAAIILFLAVGLAKFSWDKIHQNQKLASERAVALINEAKVLITNQEHERVEEILRRAYKLDPANLESLKTLMELFRFHIGDYEEALKISKQLSTLDPKNPVYLDHQASLLYGLGVINEAIEIEKKALKLDPTNINFYAHIMPMLVKEKKYGEALDYAKEFLKLDSDNALVIFYTAILCKEMKNVECAEKYFDKLLGVHIEENEINLFIDSEKNFHTLLSCIAADFFNEYGKIEKALSILNKGMVMNPNDFRLRDCKSMLLSKESGTKVGEALGATLLNPNDPSLMTWYGLVQAGKGKIKSAINALEKGIELGDKSSDTKYTLGILYNNAGRYEDAEGQFKEGLNLDSNKNLSGKKKQIIGEIYHHLCLSYVNRKMTKEAIKACNEALTHGKDDSRIHVTFGLIYMGLEKYDEAEKAFFKSLALDGENGVAKSAILTLYKKTNRIEDYNRFYNEQRALGGYQYLHPADGVTFRAPLFWKMSQDREYDSEVLFYNEPSDAVEYNYRPSVFLIVYLGVSNIDDVFKIKSEYVKKVRMGEIQNFNVINTSDNSYKSTWTEFDIILGKDKTHFREHILFKGDKAYALVAGALADRFNKYEPDFKMSLSSLKFVEKK
ncbi:MAG: hypothetical protein A3F82_03085 [Deltaproteobacteria bacterium RIFCSPLOWO2_12_FULL_44_12]|nr:MAG: hypothetical protein A2712_06385 [Deltaproteobacteria bacterium RIFCSPHIGHO2_01_FULL_43_49]OGQ15991.1 MAG: hypothetical protein A3D22_06285 [Deltaproteobacteria bacterium RIFCSPHIGHO2_02_FULL_44_53]OGQ28948.1 MAG: hypothetical protein A3D98_03870 [Deltaproteobacteria bacterium RIFCSPHIGHO2_12_FULL_44_21]OGQ33181.1 MAG: hypothetical protein A2979_04155 [Deltaproteobacteria bacterium RIFCSPLOWO2_01_FULL_45_74]OGQ42277.1 MAG: hypothetical protein A3I70_06460 [Deltaproteobacteria bacterium 